MGTNPTDLPVPFHAVVCVPVLMAVPARCPVRGRCARPGCSRSGWCARFSTGRESPGTGPGRTRRSVVPGPGPPHPNRPLPPLLTSTADPGQWYRYWA